MKSPIAALQEKNERTEEKKWPKQAALYIYRPGTEYQCKDCYFYMQKKCALYGDRVSIEPYGTCGLWVELPAHSASQWIGGLTKEETGYAENKAGFSCKRCEYFGNMDCSKVDKNSPGDTQGKISPDGCCNRWEIK